MLHLNGRYAATTRPPPHHHNKILNTPYRWGLDGRPEGSVRPSSSPAAFSNPGGATSTVDQNQSPVTAGPYGARSCVKCDPHRWYRGTYLGGWGGVVGAKLLAESGGSDQWSATVTDRQVRRVLSLCVHVLLRNPQHYFGRSVVTRVFAVFPPGSCL